MIVFIVVEKSVGPNIVEQNRQVLGSIRKTFQREEILLPNLDLNPNFVTKVHRHTVKTSVTAQYRKGKKSQNGRMLPIDVQLLFLHGTNGSILKYLK